MLDIGQLRLLAKTPGSAIHLVSDVKVHVALDPGYINNIETGVRISLNSKLHEYLQDLQGILMGFENVKRKSSGILCGDNPFLHLDVKAKFFVFRPVVGENLFAIVTTKSAGNLGGVVHDVFDISIQCTTNIKHSIGLGEPVMVSLDRVAYVGKKPIFLATLVSTESGNVAIEEDSDSGVDSEKNPLPTVAGGAEKRKTENDVEDEAERKRQRKAAKKAKKERERMEASEVAVTGNLDESQVVDQRKTIEFTSPTSKAHGALTEVKSPRAVKMDENSLPEGFQIIVKETDKKKWKEYLGPDGKKYRSLNDIKKRFVEGGIQNVPVQGSAPAANPTKAKLKDETKKHIVEVIDDVVNTWNLNHENDELLEDHPKYLAYSDAQLQEMDPFSKVFWIEPEKRKRMKKEVEVGASKIEKEPVKKSKSEKTKATVSRIEHDPNLKEFMETVEEEILSEAEKSKDQDSMETMLEQLSQTETKKKKKKKKNKHLERTM